MADKILEAKNDIRRIIKNKGLTRIEKCNLVKEKSAVLDEEELKILLKEYHRDYASYDRFKDLKEVISMLLTALGMLVAVCGISFNGIEFGADMFGMLILYIVVYTVIAVWSVTGIQTFRSKNMNNLQYILDILEDGKNV